MDGFLDLARSIFCRLTEQIHDMAESLRTELQLPALKVQCAGTWQSHGHQQGICRQLLLQCHVTLTLSGCSAPNLRVS